MLEAGYLSWPWSPFHPSKCLGGLLVQNQTQPSPSVLWLLILLLLRADINRTGKNQPFSFDAHKYLWQKDTERTININKN